MAEHFSGKAGQYAKGRVGYPEALYDALYGRYGFSPGNAIADVGAGTGAFSRELLKRGSRVWAVEPDAQMLQKAADALGGHEAFHAVAATAEHTGLLDGAFDHVTCASAFHWLDTEAFRAECLRLLRPGGSVVLVWKVRDAQSPLGRALTEVLAAHCRGFTGLSHGFDACQQDIRRFYGEKFDTLRVQDDAVQDRERFRARILSSSYAPGPQDEGYAALCRALDELFDRFEQDGVVTVPTSAIAFIGAPRG